MSIIKSKPCTVEGCNNPRWAKSFCKRHQSLRTDSKKPKSIKKISEKGKVQKDLKKELVQNDMAFYLTEVWLKREHRCFETNKPLGPKPLITYFHHVLPKQTYPQFRHCEWNIVLLHPDVHNQVEINIEFTPKVKALTAKLKEQYGKVKYTTTADMDLPEVLGDSRQRAEESLRDCI